MNMASHKLLNSSFSSWIWSQRGPIEVLLPRSFVDFASFFWVSFCALTASNKRSGHAQASRPRVAPNISKTPFWTLWLWNPLLLDMHVTSVDCQPSLIPKANHCTWTKSAHTHTYIYIYIIYTYIWSYIYTYIIIYLIYLPMSSKWQEDQQFWAMSRQARAFCSGVASWNDYIPRSQHCESTSSLEASAASFCACGQWIPEARPHNYHLVNSPGMSCPLLLFVTYSMLIL